MGKTTKQWDRKFLGKTENFNNKEEQKFEKAHLKAYLRGYDQFKYGKEDVLNKDGFVIGTRDKFHKVKQELIKH